MRIACLLAEFGLTHALELLAVGVAAGVLGGLLGIGGGIVMIPGLVLLLGRAYGENSFHAYKLAAITTSLVLSLPAIARHRRAEAVMWPAVAGIAPLALVGVVVGVLIAGTFVDEHSATLRRIFGGFLEVAVAIQLYQEWCSRRGRDYLVRSAPLPRRHRWRYGLCVGLPAGVIAGLLGVGGGVWAVPVQRLLFGVRIRNAIANSACMILFVSALTAVLLSVDVARHAHDPPLYVVGWKIAALLAPGAFLGSWIGAGLTHKLPVRSLRYGFMVVLVVTGVRLMVG